MSVQTLQEAVDSFAEAATYLTEEQLGRPWGWRDYDSDGVRFAYFRTLEELRSLAVELSGKHAAADAAPSSARLIMNQYHCAWRDMHSLLLGTDEDDRGLIPAPDEWPLRRVIAHIIDADVGFYTVCSETLRSLRAGKEPPHKVTDAMWEQVIESLGVDFESLIKGPSGPLLEFDRRMHTRILDELSRVTDEELASPSYYWEASAYTLRFRLGRFESHCRQHSVQLYKTRIAIGRPPSESQLLLGQVYAALAAVENEARAGETGGDLMHDLAAAIRTRAEEVIEAAGG